MRSRVYCSLRIRWQAGEALLLPQAPQTSRGNPHREMDGWLGPQHAPAVCLFFGSCACSPGRVCMADTGVQGCVREASQWPRAVLLPASQRRVEGPQKPRHRPRDVKMSESLVPRRGDAPCQVFKVLTIFFFSPRKLSFCF